MFEENQENEIDALRDECKRLLPEFRKWLVDKRLSDKVINNHVSNVEFYLDPFLINRDVKSAAEGVEEIGYFLGYWFISKAMWASRTSIKSNIASLKKFYQFMLQRGEISAAAYDDMKERIKEEKEEWLATIDRYDDPDVDVNDVWGF